jgi:hypothetical protein
MDGGSIILKLVVRHSTRLMVVIRSIRAVPSISDGSVNRPGTWLR